MSGYYKQQRDAAMDKYKRQSQDAMGQMLRDIGKSTSYAIDQNRKAKDRNLKAIEDYNNKVKNTDVYTQSLNKAMGGAQAAGQAQAANAQNASRAAGMSKSAAAEAAMNANNQGFNNALGQQQSLAANAIDTQLGRQGSNMMQSVSQRENAATRAGANAMAGASAAGGARQYGADAYKNAAGMYGQADQQEFDRSGQIAGAGADALTAGAQIATDLSDANTKDLCKNNNDPFADIDALLKKHYKGDK